MCVAAALVGGALLSAGTAIYSADQSRKGQHQAMDAQSKAIADDQRQKAELDTSTALAANQKFATDRRARQANALALGGTSDPLGGGPAGGQVVGAAGQSTTGGSQGTVLGRGGYSGGGVVANPGSVLGSGGGTNRQPSNVRPY